MDTSVTVDQNGATFNITIPYNTFADVVLMGLLEAAKQIEHWKQPEDVDTWEAIMQLIPYFSTPDQMKELAHYQADADWINIVAAKAA